MSYERDVSFCKPSPYVKKVTVATVAPAQNSDNLDRVTFQEMGWNAVAPRGRYRVGDQVTFIPAESVLPKELSDALGVTKYLNKGRVHVVQLRGNRSEGLIVEEAAVADYLPQILKWEDPPSVAMSCGFLLPFEDTNPGFQKFYKMPNLLNEPDTFEPGEPLAYSEKLHGTNTRFGLLVCPRTGLLQLHAGSHENAIDVARERADNLYVAIARSVEAKLPPGVVFYGEIHGRKIQHLDYGLSQPALRVFAAAVDGTYVLPDEVRRLCELHGLPVVTFHEAVFESVEQLRALAEQPSEYTDRHGREGVVVVSRRRPGVMAKVISFAYQTGKGRTERH